MAATQQISTNGLHSSYVPLPEVEQITQSIPAADFSQADFIEADEEFDDTAWQDFLTYCAEVQS